MFYCVNKWHNELISFVFHCKESVKKKLGNLRTVLIMVSILKLLYMYIKNINYIILRYMTLFYIIVQVFILGMDKSAGGDL